MCLKTKAKHKYKKYLINNVKVAISNCNNNDVCYRLRAVRGVRELEPGGRRRARAGRRRARGRRARALGEGRRHRRRLQVTATPYHRYNYVTLASYCSLRHTIIIQDLGDF